MSPARESRGGRSPEAQPPQPWVTVLLPVYNGKPYLREAVDSVLGQSDAEWELLIVDDCSGDGSWDLVQPLAGPRVRVARNATNLGLYGTLAARVNEVQTPWTTLLFQDDRLAPSHLAELRRVAASYPRASALWPAIHVIDAAGAMVHQGLDTGRVEDPPLLDDLEGIRHRCHGQAPVQGAPDVQRLGHLVAGAEPHGRAAGGGGVAPLAARLSPAVFGGLLGTQSRSVYSCPRCQPAPGPDAGG